MLTALLITCGWQTLNLILLFAAARMGIFTGRVAKPAKPKPKTEATT